MTSGPAAAPALEPSSSDGPSAGPAGSVAAAPDAALDASIPLLPITFSMSPSPSGASAPGPASNGAANAPPPPSSPNPSAPSRMGYPPPQILAQQPVSAPPLSPSLTKPAGSPTPSISPHPSFTPPSPTLSPAAAPALSPQQAQTALNMGLSHLNATLNLLSITVSNTTLPTTAQAGPQPRPATPAPAPLPALAPEQARAALDQSLAQLDATLSLLPITVSSVLPGGPVTGPAPAPIGAASMGPMPAATLAGPPALSPQQAQALLDRSLAQLNASLALLPITLSDAANSALPMVASPAPAPVPGAFTSPLQLPTSAEAPGGSSSMSPGRTADAGFPSAAAPVRALAEPPSVATAGPAIGPSAGVTFPTGTAALNANLSQLPVSFLPTEDQGPAGEAQGPGVVESSSQGEPCTALWLSVSVSASASDETPWKLLLAMGPAHV